MNVVDVIIIALLILGGVAGFKAGVIKKLTDFIGMFVVIILAFYLKNYISVIMYENLPFFNFFGLINGIDALNILLYEVIAFLVIFIALLFVLKVVLMLTGLVEKILKATVILSIPSKLLGIVVGVIEMYVYLFLILVIVSLPIFDSSFLKDSKMNNFILNNTPVLSGVSGEIIDIYGDVYNIIDNRKNKTNEQLNEEILKVLIDKKVVTKESAKKLVDKNKIHINDKSIVE
jgi:colicin V production protein